MAKKIKVPSMVYIAGEEMTRYTMQQVLDKWVLPFIDTTAWQNFDMSAKNRDDTEDKVVADAVKAGAEIGAIFKEPTVTPTKDQAEKWGLKRKDWGSPNGAMRRGWNGISISRDTIHVPGLELGYKNPVLFDRHAVGGEYGGGWKEVGKGTLKTVFVPEGGGEPIEVDARTLKDERNVAVTYHNPLDNVKELAQHFFSRSLAAGVTPYVVTKKTVFKWQEPFWEIMKQVFDAEYKDKFEKAGLGGELQHLISDAATMKLQVWKDGGFAMVAHNYDGDMLTDLISQAHRSPAFIDSGLVGIAADGRAIKEFEASHGTVADMDEARKKGERTSLNPLGLVDALIKAMDHAAHLESAEKEAEVKTYTESLRAAMYKVMVGGKGTDDIAGAGKGSSTEEYIDLVAAEL